MFNKIKHLKNLRSQAKTLEGILADESVTVNKKGVTIVMNGNQKVTSLTIADGTMVTDVAAVLPGLINDANDKVRRIMAQKIQSMGGLDKFTSHG